MIEKNEEYTVDIIDNGYEGEGIAKIDNFAVFIPTTIKGEKVKIKIVKVLSSYAFGKALEILQPSIHRVEMDCTTYTRCGGCNLRHIEYKKTLEMKQETVQNLVNKSLQDKITVSPTIGMEEPYHYRNKLQYPFGLMQNGEPSMGVFANRSHEIIPIQNCLIQDSKAEEIAKFILQFVKENKISIYQERNQKGLLRHVVIKVGKYTGEIMCILVINGKELPKEKMLVEELTKRFPNIKSIIKNINRNNTNVILGTKNINLLGDGYIYDKLGEYTFKISALSFYQTNPIQTETLYNIAIEMAQLTGKEIVFDLYCGIGTIGIFAARHAKKVYGIEIIPEAIEDAKVNATINQITNIEFTVGDVEKVFSEELASKAEVVFVDPPRKGLDSNTIMELLKIKSQKIIYISCNPATLVRDLKALEELYEIKQIQPVDMFPFTHHCETVSILQLKSTVENLKLRGRI